MAKEKLAIATVCQFLQEEWRNQEAEKLRWQREREILLGRLEMLESMTEQQVGVIAMLEKRIQMLEATLRLERQNQRPGIGTENVPRALGQGHYYETATSTPETSPPHKCSAESPGPRDFSFWPAISTPCPPRAGRRSSPCLVPSNGGYPAGGSARASTSSPKFRQLRAVHRSLVYLQPSENAKGPSSAPASPCNRTSPLGDITGSGNTLSGHSESPPLHGGRRQVWGSAPGKPFPREPFARVRLQSFPLSPEEALNLPPSPPAVSAAADAARRLGPCRLAEPVTGATATGPVTATDPGRHGPAGDALRRTGADPCAVAALDPTLSAGGPPRAAAAADAVRRLETSLSEMAVADHCLPESPWDFEPAQATTQPPGLLKETLLFGPT